MLVIDFFSSLISVLFLLVTLGVFLFSLDDIFLDFLAVIYNARPTKLSANELDHLRRLPQKRIAILIANWKEEDVLAQMVRGNLAQIEYENYSIFLGVYPNDLATWEIARSLETHPQVSVIVNKVHGPTSKGQLLNEMVKQIFASEKESMMHYDAFLLHDSEDLIHPKSLALLNRELTDADFVQIPVFSLKTPMKELTAGTYADEFAESHTKSLLVRSHLGAAVPSAGVGTAISRSLIQALQNHQAGSFLNEATLTEDYQLGITAKRLGFTTKFVCKYYFNDNKKEFIATREYFPEKIATSIRQKSRWTAGISFQGNENLGWNGNLIDKYFLWRDRKGPINSVLIFTSALIVLSLATGHLLQFSIKELFDNGPTQILLFANFINMGLRLIERMRATHSVYGLKFSLLVPIRWPIANYVNCLATWNAFRSFRASKKSGKQMAWVKTQHKLPAQFGQTEARKPLSTPEKGASA